MLSEINVSQGEKQLAVTIAMVNEIQRESHEKHMPIFPPCASVSYLTLPNTQLD